MPHKNKLCAICGKIENRNWAYHWKQQHKGCQPRELIPGEVPQDQYDDNWLFIAKNKDEKIFDKYATAMGMLDPPAPPTLNPQAIDNPEYIEIVDEDDEPHQLEEETLHDVEQNILRLDLSSMKTPAVIQLVDEGLKVISERLRGRESALSAQLGKIARSLQILPSKNYTKSRLWLNVRNEAYKAFMKGKQSVPTNNTASRTQIDFNNCLDQKVEVLNNIKDVEFAIQTLHELSLPVWLSINQGIGEIGYYQSSLKPRSKLLLQPTPCKEKSCFIQPQAHENIPPLTQAEELALSFPYLYDKLDRLAEKEEKKGPVPIEVEQMTDKVELKKGISIVDITRKQLHRVRKTIKSLDSSKIRSLGQIKTKLLKEINNWRLQLNRGFQQFMNAMLISHYKVDGLNTQVTLIFQGNKNQRSFTISTMPKEKRKFNGSANDHYQVIGTIAKNTSGLCESIENFATASQSNNGRGLKIYMKGLLKAIEDYNKNGHHKDHQKGMLKHAIDETIQLISEASTPKKQDKKVLRLTKGTFNDMKEYVLGKIKIARKHKMRKHK